MGETEISLKYRKEKQNRECVQLFFHALLENNWDAAQTLFLVTDNSVYTSQSKVELFGMLNFDNENWMKNNLLIEK